LFGFLFLPALLALLFISAPRMSALCVLSGDWARLGRSGRGGLSRRTCSSFSLFLLICCLVSPSRLWLVLSSRTWQQSSTWFFHWARVRDVVAPLGARVGHTLRTFFKPAACAARRVDPLG